LAAEQAAKVIEPEQTAMLNDLNTAFRFAIESGQPYQAMELDEQFHSLIIDIADNPYIANFSASLQIHIRRFKYVFLKQPGTSTLVSADEHDALIAALRAHDAALAAETIRRNIIRPMNELYANL
jgi:DNA-binding GntR family transcriptional regulator